MRQARSRALAFGALAAAVAAFFLALSAALGAHTGTLAAAKGASATVTTTNVRFPDARVVVRNLPSGTCFTVSDRSASARSCAASVGSGEISYARTPHGLGGVAGADVRAVIVRLTRRGTVWATLHGGAFYAAIPHGYRPRAVVKVLKDGSRLAFTVT